MPLIALSLVLDAIGIFMLYAYKEVANPGALLSLGILVLIAATITMLYGLRMFFLGELLLELRRMNEKMK